MGVGKGPSIRRQRIDKENKIGLEIIEFLEWKFLVEVLWALENGKCQSEKMCLAENFEKRCAGEEAA